MTRLLVAILMAAASLTASATELNIREVRTFTVSSPETNHPLGERQPVRQQSAFKAESAPGTLEPDGVFNLYPIAGTNGRDYYIPYYVDMDLVGGRQDFNCSDFTFNGHMGHDPYIRTFREMDIGVPVFAVKDGIVYDVHDGEPDRNTDNNLSARANFVILQHPGGQQTSYVHLRRGSITVAKGDRVTAGTQIGLIGSSGASTGPHLHFDWLVGSDYVEPMAGPCRPGRSYLREQPNPPTRSYVLGAAFSRSPYSGYPDPPHDEAPNTGTFLIGPQTMHFKAEFADLSSGSTLTITLDGPGSDDSSTPVTTPVKAFHHDTVEAVYWAFETNLHTPGNWKLLLDVNGRRVLEAPFTAVSDPSKIVNRPPNPITAAIEPVGLRGGEVAICRTTTAQFADPDYDVVRYRYEWKVDGEVVRTVTSAARSDALANQFVTSNRNISCSVTVSDGSLEAAPATAFAVVRSGRRHGVRR